MVNLDPPARFQGGAYHPLTESQCEQITLSAFEILQKIGIAGAPEWLQGQLIEMGARQRDDGRIVFAPGQIETALQRASHRVSLPGFDEQFGLDIGNACVHIGTGGAAVQTLDAETGLYRDSTLSDLYKMMRILDRCEHVHYGIRPLVARDMTTPLDLDINTAYACLKATRKPVGTSFHTAAHVPEVIRLFDLALGGENRFRR